MTTTSPALHTKEHFQILDGLRGVAALLVVIFHVFETYSGGDHTRQILNHGYLAVDFFFLLSGFVVGFAYDDRWDTMTTWDFFKRRLIRLQPMVIMGSIVGAIFFYTQAGPTFPLIANTPVWHMLLVMVIGFTLIPLTPGMDIRGWDEMHPLDGPAWSLFFEYLANILYATVLRRIGKTVLALLVVLSGIFLLHLAVTSPNGDVIGGWSITPHQLHIGFARLLFPFLAGLLLHRSGLRIRVPAAFAVCSLLVAAALCLPRVGSHQHPWQNGLYDAFCIIVVFPLIVAIGAGHRTLGPRDTRACKLLGGISYPLYITHYPLIYLYTGWVLDHHVPPVLGATWGILLFISAVAIAYLSLKLYDEPVRRWLAQRFLRRSSPS